MKILCCVDCHSKTTSPLIQLALPVLEIGMMLYKRAEIVLCTHMPFTDTGLFPCQCKHLPQIIRGTPTLSC